MALNSSHTPDGRGVLIYNGEMIMLYCKDVHVKFEGSRNPAFSGSKKGHLYLTTHRIIFTNKSGSDALKSFAMPFHCLRNVNLEQPIFGANYLKGTCLAQPGGNWEGEAVFKLTFTAGGCIDFGKALLKAVDLASRFRPMNAPPPYAPPAGSYFSPPPAYYTHADGNYNGFQAPTNVFPDQAPAENVYMYEEPPPYPGIGPTPPPYPAGATGGGGAPYPATGQPMTAGEMKEREARQQSGNHPAPSAPPPPSYEDATRN